MRKVKFCLKCGSTNVFWASGLPQLWSLWECRNCGYRGLLILEDGKLAEKLREEWKEKKGSVEGNLARDQQKKIEIFRVSKEVLLKSSHLLKGHLGYLEEKGNEYHAKSARAPCDR